MNTARNLRSLGLRSQMPRSIHSKVTTVEDAVSKYIKSGQTLYSGGFGLCGIPETFLTEIARNKQVQNLTAISNNAGLNDHGLDKLVNTGQLSTLIMSYLGRSKTLLKQWLTGKVDIHLTPQGTIAERIRAASAGVGAFYTATGVGTWVEEGKMPVRHNEHGECIVFSEPKETREFNGRKYILETPLRANVALIKCWRADKSGNLQFKGSTANFNQVMAKAAPVTLVEADEIVEVGTMDPNQVHVPSIHVTAIVPAQAGKYFEVITTNENSDTAHLDKQRMLIASRVAKEFKQGSYVNLGVGIPTLAPSFVDEGVDIVIQSENGILGVGPYPETEAQADPDLVNAGKETVTLLPGASLFSSDESFALIRGGKLDITVLGAMEVSQYGDLANWGVPGNIKGMGGAMDLVSNPYDVKVIVCTTHTTKKGESKIVKKCKNPLTGSKVAKLIVTDLAVFEVDAEKGLTLIELQPGATLAEVKAKTAAPFTNGLSKL